MDVSLLGQFKFDGGWVEIVIILLVIGGSVFGTISKKLIEVFSPKDSDKAEGRGGDPAGRPTQPVPPRPRGRPSQRAARPVPLPPRAAPARSAARERGMLPASPAIEAPERAVGPQTESTPPRPVRPRPKRTARSTLVPPPGVSAPAAAGGRLGHLASDVERTGGLEEVTAENRLGHLDSAIADRGAELEESVEDRLGHVDSAIADRGAELEKAVDDRLGHVGPDAWTPSAAAGKRVTILGIGRTTPRALRQAILLREILGPPVSLQPPADSF